MGVINQEFPGAAARVRLPSLLSLLALVLMLGAVHLLVGLVLDWGRMHLDDLRYGRPRTTQLSGFVGHQEAGGRPSHFIGLNLDRQVVVLQLPGGDASAVRVLPGPYLFGADEELTPVDLALRDMDDDGYVDLLITVHQEQVVYLNKSGQFRLPTPGEQAQIGRGMGP